MYLPLIRGRPCALAGDRDSTARIPIDPQLTRAFETGANYLRTTPSSPTTQPFLALARALAAQAGPTA